MIRRESILLQAAVLVLLGLAVGAVDAFALRPIRLTMVEADPNQFLDPTTGPGTKSPTPLNLPDPAKPESPTKTPAPAQTPTTTEPVKPAPPPPAQAAAPEKKNHITIEQAFAFYQKVAAYEAFFVDARTFEKFEEGHVAEAIPLNLHSFDGKTPPQLALLDPSKPIIVYCAGGNCDESEAVALNLNNFGYQHVFIMHDGYPAWAAAGHPVGTGKHPQHDAVGFQ